MGRGIVKIGDKYVIWSTVVDAPITYGMDRKELEEWVQFYHGREGVMELEERLQRVEVRGHSFLDGHDSAREYCSYNRAGPDESCLSWDELVKMVNEDV